MQTAAAAPVSMPKDLKDIAKDMAKDMAKDPFARIKGELSSLEATARDRLKGTRVGDLVERFPRALEGEVDALLDKVGLVRKARAPAVVAADVVAVVAVADAADVVAVAVASDVDVSADVVAEVAAAEGGAAAARKGKKAH